jgi:hypothetical protein
MAQYMHTGWQVTSVDSTAYVTNTKGDTVYGSRVSFQTSAGNGGSVFVANDQLTPDNVTAEINKRAAIMDTIAGLAQPAEAVEV